MNRFIEPDFVFVADRKQSAIINIQQGYLDLGQLQAADFFYGEYAQKFPGNTEFSIRRWHQTKFIFVKDYV